MRLARCEKGHYYDKDKFTACPHCNDMQVAPSETVAFEDPNAKKEEPEVVVPPAPKVEVEERVLFSAATSVDSMNRPLEEKPEQRIPSVSEDDLDEMVTIQLDEQDAVVSAAIAGREEITSTSWENKVAEETPEPEESKVTEEAPAPEESKVAEEAPEPEESKVAEEAPEPEESKVAEEAPAPEESKVAEEAPAPEESKVTEEAPEPEESKVAEETPEPEESKVAEETPAPEESKVAEEAPAPEESKVVEESPAPEESKVAEEAPTPEESKAAEEAPAPEESKAAWEAPVQEKSKVIEEVPAPEESKAAWEAPVQEKSRVIGEAPVPEESKAIGEVVGIEEEVVAVTVEPKEEPTESLQETLASAVSSRIPDDILPEEMNSNPVIGWLIAIEGVHKGRSYEVKQGRNFIGRSTAMDVCLSGNPKISRDRHAIITYDPRAKKCYLQPDESRDLIYINDDLLFGPMPMKHNDVITLGEEQFVFLSLQCDKADWI